LLRGWEGTSSERYLLAAPLEPAAYSCSSCASYSEDCFAALHWHPPIFYIRKLFANI